jgi:hypothetical protein
MTDSIEIKQVMPGLGPNGVTEDYYNFINQLRIVGEWMGGGIEKVRRYLQDNPLPLYTEAYPEDKYQNVVNSYNREFVARLNTIIRELNEYGAKGSLSVEQWKRLDLEAARLIYGDR